MEPSESMQTGFWIAAGILVLFQVFSGWSAGPARMLARLVILVFSLAAGYYGGNTAAAALGERVPMPAVALAVFSGLIIAIFSYLALSIIAATVLKRTKDQESSLIRFFYGVTGSVVGFFTGIILVWFILLGLRVAGTVAEARLDVAGNNPESEAEPELPQIVSTVARLKASVDSGAVNATLNATDIVPDKVYRTLDAATRVLTDQQASAKFMQFPGAEELSRQPAIAALAKNDEVVKLVEKRELLKLLTHPSVVEAISDPQLFGKLSEFPLDEALDFALERAEPEAPPEAEATTP